MINKHNIMNTILLIIAIVLFVLAAFGVQIGVVAFTPLGLAFFAGAFLVPLIGTRTRV